MNFQLLTTSCTDILDYHETGDKPRISELKSVIDSNTMLNYGNINDKRIINSCYQYDKGNFNKAYNDVLSRDHDVLSNVNYFNRVYAIVLLNKHQEYIGHIYSWSSVDPNILFSIGIRSRPDMIFLRALDMGMKNISHYLIEGVRLLGKELGVNKIIIPKALRNMKTILIRDLGFSLMDIDTYLLKFPSPLYHSSDKQTTILQLSNINTPLTLEANNINFLYYD
jgi:hypothetical protein